MAIHGEHSVNEAKLVGKDVTGRSNSLVKETKLVDLGALSNGLPKISVQAPKILHPRAQIQAKMC